MKNLISIVQSKNKLYEQIIRIKRLAKVALDQIEVDFPSFTDHTIRHSDKIIEILDKLIYDSQDKNFLNDIEIYILLAAAYLHDIGMASNYNLRGGNTNSDLIFIREKHHDLSASIAKSYSQANFGLLGQPDPILYIDDIAKVMKGHRKVNLESEEYDDSYCDLEIVRLRLLASLLRLADELDILQYRANEKVLNSCENANVINLSALHNFKHNYVKGCKIKDGSIKIIYQLPEGFEEKYIKIFDVLTLQKIDKILHDIDSTLRKYGIMWKLENSAAETNSNVTPMPDNVLQIGQSLYHRNFFEKRQKEDEEYYSVMGKPVTSGSVVEIFDPTLGVDNV